MHKYAPEYGAAPVTFRAAKLLDAGALITGLTNVQVARPLRSVIQVSSLISSRRPTGRGGPS